MHPKLPRAKQAPAVGAQGHLRLRSSLRHESVSRIHRQIASVRMRTAMHAQGPTLTNQARTYNLRTCFASGGDVEFDLSRYFWEVPQCGGFFGWSPRRLSPALRATNASRSSVWRWDCLRRLGTTFSCLAVRLFKPLQVDPVLDDIQILRRQLTEPCK